MKNIKLRAFTILETLVTLLAISIMIAGPVAFVAKSYHYSNFVTQKIIATGLSQEALELATSMRNYNLSDFKNMSLACTNSCAIDWNGDGAVVTYSSCDNASENCNMYLLDNPDGSRSYRTIFGGETSDFYRYIKVTTNGTESYTIEADTYTYVDKIKLEVKLKKVFFPIVIK